MKYYYKDPLAAAYMAREFGIKLYWLNKKGAKREPQSHKTVLGYAYEANLELPDRFYIHPDSHHIFEPIVCDVGVDDNGTPVEYAAGAWVGDGSPVGVEPVRIIQRNGRPFFWPEVEND